MTSPYRTPVTESVMVPKCKVPDYCSKKKAPSKNIMTRTAHPNSTIMASKHVEIGLRLRSPPVLPLAIYFVLLTSPPLMMMMMMMIPLLKCQTVIAVYNH